MESEKAKAAEEREEQQQQQLEENEVLIRKAQVFMDRIVATHQNPSPSALHALATMVQAQESSCMEDSVHSSTKNSSSAHNIKRLVNLIRENGKFFELISSKFLADNRYPVSVQVAAMRLLCSCTITWKHPLLFKDDVLENIRGCAISKIPMSSGDYHDWKQEIGRRNILLSEMLQTYSTGLLAVCLPCGGKLVEDVLSSRLPAKLMRYLRARVLGETSTGRKDSYPLAETKSASSMVCSETRGENQNMVRNATERSHLCLVVPEKHTSVRDHDGDLVTFEETEMNHESYANRQGCHADFCVYEEPSNSMALEDACEGKEYGDKKCNIIDSHELELRPFVKSLWEDFGENIGNDSYRRMPSCGFQRPRGTSYEGVPENEQALTCPCGNSSGQPRSMDRSLIKNQNSKTMAGAKRNQNRSEINDTMLERAVHEVGSKDISYVVKQALRAVEAEENAVDVPAVAIKTAGSDAAKVVKTAAFEEYKRSNDEEALVVAATGASSTVIDVNDAVLLSRKTISVNDDSRQLKPSETHNNDIGEFVILDTDSLAKLRERFCIRCLVILGKHVEALCSVLSEKGVDVICALLLQVHEKASTVLLLNDILKLLCALASHRKFAALFVHRGGVQILLSVPRDVSTFFDLSSCLLAIGSIQEIMQRICALPSYVVSLLVKLSLQLLECQQDEARKNAALFFSHAFVFNDVVTAFDAYSGMQKLLCLLRGIASVRSGVASGQLNDLGSLQNDPPPSEVLTSLQMQIAHHACVALRQYFRAHLLLFVDSVHSAASFQVPRDGAVYEALDTSNEVMNAIVREIQKDRRLARAFVRTRWHVVHRFLKSNGHITMLELCQAFPVQSYMRDMLPYALGILHIVTLVPTSRNLLVNAILSSGRLGIAVILDAANGATYVEPEIVEPALHLLVNLVYAPRSIRNKSGSTKQASASTTASVFIRYHRIYLGAGSVSARLATELEQRYHHARQAVLANKGVKVLLQLLGPKLVISPAALDCILALTCQALLGLAEDDSIVHIQAKLRVEEKLLQFIRNSGSQTPGGEQNQWRAGLDQVSFKLTRVVSNSRRAITSVASAAATPHSSELLLLIHELLQAFGSAQTAAFLLNKFQLTSLPSSNAPSSLSYQGFDQKHLPIQIQRLSGRAPCGCLSDNPEVCPRLEDSGLRCDSVDSVAAVIRGITSVSDMKSVGNVDVQTETPIDVPMKRKVMDLRENGLVSSRKRFDTGEHKLEVSSFFPPNVAHSSDLQPCAHLFYQPGLAPKDYCIQSPLNFLLADIDENRYTGSQVGQISSQNRFLNGPQTCGSDQVTLDSLVMQYLKYQHRQLADPVATLPQVSVLQPHVRPEPRHSIDAPSNVTARLSTREFRSMHGGIHGCRKDRQYVYSRFRRWQTCRDEISSMQTCLSFLEDPSRIAIGYHSGKLKVFGSNRNRVLESCTGHRFPLTLLQSCFVGVNHLVLSSTAKDVCLWDASSISSGPQHFFGGIKAACFSNSGCIFAAVRSDPSHREVHLYDVQTCQLDIKLSDRYWSTDSGRGDGRSHEYSLVQFSPSDSTLLWNGVLWDRRGSDPIHRFNRFSDYGGGGFHPAGNQVIINSNVLDLRNMRLLHSVPSLDQTVIKFNATGDVIYAILRRNFDDVYLAHETHRLTHPLFCAFRTVDAVNYSNIARIPVGRCLLDLAIEPTNSFVGLSTMHSSARVYEIGRRNPTDDDSDADSLSEDEDW